MKRRILAVASALLLGTPACSPGTPTEPAAEASTVGPSYGEKLTIPPGTALP